jgi:hypothetical protein
MQSIGALRERYHWHVGDDPLAVSEAATVGLMLSAAGEAGLIGMLEYPTEKRIGGPRRWCYGRCDLWLLAPRHADDYGWAVEVKHRRITPRSTRRLIIDPFKAAWKDAGRLDVTEALMRLACVVYYARREIAPGSEVDVALGRLAVACDWAWRISHARHLHPAYIFLKQRRRGVRH